MIPGQLPPTDVPPADMFGSVLETEKTAVVTAHARVELLRRTLALSEALVGLGQTAYYQRFVEEIASLRDGRLAELLTSKSDREASLLIGQAKALDDILSLMRNEEENRVRLAAALKAAEDRLAKLTNPKTEFAQ